VDIVAGNRQGAHLVYLSCIAGFLPHEMCNLFHWGKSFRIRKRELRSELLRRVNAYGFPCPCQGRVEQEHGKDWPRLIGNNEEIGSNLQNTVGKKALLIMTPCLRHGNQGLSMKAHSTKGDR
jgi:hypothetical protein